MRISPIFLFILSLTFLGCPREPIVFPVEPQIELMKVTPKEVSEFNSIQISLRYRDGDGDLGGQPDGNPDLILRDLRDSSQFPSGYDGFLRYSMPKFYEGPPQSIQGTIDVTVPGIARLDPRNPKEPVTFEIYVFDRAGHKSNTVRTDTCLLYTS
ncbi:MAG: hypothetical protein N2170_05480, partial [Bacteroidia bacterium]|nr:hypothetical protein [Bacteroidia bacterium]